MPKRSHAKPSKTSLSEIAYSLVKEQILLEELAQGSKLICSTLEHQFGMSKTPIAHALDRLVDEGMVFHRRHSGYYVGQPTTETSPPPPEGSDEGTASPYIVPIETTVSRSPSLTQVAYIKLKHMIFRSQFSPGQKLIYADLERLLGISKTPIINALNRLEADGYVYQKKNVGYFLKEVNLQDILDMFRARWAVETANIDFILENLGGLDTRALEKIHQDFVTCSPGIYSAKRLYLNRQFHFRIAQIGNNPFMMRYVTNAYELFELRMWYRLYFLSSKRVREVEGEHGAILDALQRKDKRGFRRAMTHHLKGPLHTLSRQMKSRQTSKNR